MAKLDDHQLEAIVSQQIALAKSHDKHERETERSKALDYYLGKMDTYVPPEPNRSKVVSRDVADTIGWMLPQIIRVYTASDRMAVAEPVEEGDVPFAKQATDGMNYVFWKDNKGYEIIYSATWDALLIGNGIVKTWYDDTPVYATSFHSGLTKDQLALLLQPDEDGEEPEVLAKDEQVAVMPDEFGAPVETYICDVKIRRKKADGRFVIEVVPPEKFLKDGDSISLDEAAFTAHWEQKMRSDLIEMGYDKDEVMAIPQAVRVETPEQASRRMEMTREDATDKSTELVDYYECFIRIDVDGDGEAELVRACFGGSDSGKLLDWEVWEDENPFDDIPCEPIPHRWTARSIADETMDVQDVKTVLSRQALNNIYANNNPQRFAQGDFDNPDELVTPTFGGVVFGKMGSSVTALEVPFFANHAFEAIAYQDDVIQRRTGVGRNTMALDPETLQNQTATANQNQKDAGYSQVELVARNMAEWGWRKVFRKLLRLIIKHQDVPRVLMMNGKSVKIDPRFWNADMDVTINVGLGTGSRDRDLMMLQQVLNTQIMLADRFIAGGMSQEAIDMLPKILRTMTKMAESAGIRNPEEFYPEYTAEKVQQLQEMAAQMAEKPNPKIEEIQATGEVQKELKAVDAQVSQHEAELKAQGEIAKNTAELQADMQTKAADRENAIIIAQHQGQIELQKQDRELQWRTWDAERNRELEREKMANAAQIAAMKPKPQEKSGKPT